TLPAEGRPTGWGSSLRALTRTSPQKRSTVRGVWRWRARQSGEGSEGSGEAPRRLANPRGARRLSACGGGWREATVAARGGAEGGWRWRGGGGGAAGKRRRRRSGERK